MIVGHCSMDVAIVNLKSHLCMTEGGKAGVSRRRDWCGRRGWCERKESLVCVERKGEWRVRGSKGVGRHVGKTNTSSLHTNAFTTFTEAPGAHRTGGGGGVRLQGRPRQVLGVRVREQGVLP